MSQSPTEIIAAMQRPEWPVFFMTLACLYGQRSPDQETKNAAIIVDWPSKVPLGYGFNGHPRHSDGLPTVRPGKYPFMVHSEANAIANLNGRASSDAWVFVTMSPCEMCLGALLNLPFIQIKRIFYYEYRDYPHATELLNSIKRESRPIVAPFSDLVGENKTLDACDGLLSQTSQYLKLRSQHLEAVRAGATLNYNEQRK